MLVSKFGVGLTGLKISNTNNIKILKGNIMADEPLTDDQLRDMEMQRYQEAADREREREEAENRQVAEAMETQRLEEEKIKHRELKQAENRQADEACCEVVKKSAEQIKTVDNSRTAYTNSEAKRHCQRCTQLEETIAVLHKADTSSDRLIYELEQKVWKLEQQLRSHSDWIGCEGEKERIHLAQVILYKPSTTYDGSLGKNFPTILFPCSHSIRTIEWTFRTIQERDDMLKKIDCCVKMIVLDDTKPLDVKALAGTWPGTPDDGFEAMIDKQRHQET